MPNTRYADLAQLSAQQSSAEVFYNKMQAVFDGLMMQAVISGTTTAQPGSPLEEDAYIVPTGATGTQWGGGTHTNQVTVYVNGTWYFLTPVEGWTFRVQDDDSFLYYDGSAWVRHERRTIQTGVTASTTQTQGAATQLTSERCTVTTVANANDAVKLSLAAKGIDQIVFNAGANTLQVFPSSGDAIDAAAVNASTTIAAGKGKLFSAFDATTFRTLVGA